MQMKTHDSVIFPVLTGWLCQSLPKKLEGKHRENKTDEQHLCVYNRVHMTFQESLPAQNYCESLRWEPLTATLIQETRSSYFYLKKQIHINNHGEELHTQKQSKNLVLS